MLHTSKNIDRLAHKTEATFRPVARLNTVTVPSKKGGRGVQHTFVSASQRSAQKVKIMFYAWKSRSLANKKEIPVTRTVWKIVWHEGDGTLAISILERIWNFAASWSDTPFVPMLHLVLFSIFSSSICSHPLARDAHRRTFFLHAILETICR